MGLAKFSDDGDAPGALHLTLQGLQRTRQVGLLPSGKPCQLCERAGGFRGQSELTALDSTRGASRLQDTDLHPIVAVNADL